MRTTAPLTLLAALLASAPARGEERDRLADALAVQEAVRQSIARAEPSVACVLVSRSERYKAHEAVRPDEPGRLGRFDLRGVARDDPEHAALRRLDLSDPNNVPQAYGSGVVLDEAEGLVLTLAHVIHRATKIYVRLPGGRGSWADVHAADPRSDLAVLRLIDRVPNLKAIKLGDGGKLRKGDFVLSLSNPFAAGFRDGSPSASWGIVSNLRRRVTGVLSDVPSNERNARLPLYCFGTLIQTDVRLNLGCSGGALLNLQGELVGLTSSQAGLAGGETPGGFAVPLDAGYRRIIAALRRGEEVEYGFLGVYLQPADRAAEGHVQIDGVVPGGPAAHAGLRGGVGRGGFRDNGGDVIVAINGTPIHDNDDLFRVVAMHLAGTTVRVEVAARPGDPPRTCEVTLAKFPALEPKAAYIASRRPPARGGLRVDWSSTRPDPRRGIAPGVLVTEVTPNSPADRAHLRPDSYITRVNNREVNNPAEFYREMERARGSIELTVSTPGGGEERVTLDGK